MKVKVKLLSKAARMPERATDGSAGLDFYATSVKRHDPHMYEYSTGISMEIPKGHVGLIFPRSSIYKTSLMLSNCVGVIDSDYRGEIKFLFRNVEGQSQRQPYGGEDKIGQMVIMPIPKVELVDADDLSKTERGEGGFGSTDKSKKKSKGSKVAEGLKEAVEHEKGETELKETVVETNKE